MNAKDEAALETSACTMFQADRIANTKALRQEQVWQIGGT